MTETDKAFLDDAPFLWNTRRLTDEDFHRLFTLARRGAAIPDVPTEEMRKTGVDARWQSAIRDANNVYEIYRAMIQTALKEGK